MDTRHIEALDLMSKGLNPKDFGTTAIKDHRCNACGETIKPGHVYIRKISSDFARYPTAEPAWTPKMGPCLAVKEHLACSTWGGRRLVTLMLESVGLGRRKYRWRPSQNRKAKVAE